MPMNGKIPPINSMQTAPFNGVNSNYNSQNLVQNSAFNGVNFSNSNHQPIQIPNEDNSQVVYPVLPHSLEPGKQ